MNTVMEALLKDLEQQPAVIVLVGISGSGKSTLASQLAGDQDERILSSDYMRHLLTGDADNQEVQDNHGGMLCMAQPWPGMLRGIWGDDERFVQQYWSKVPGKYLTGDNARRDDDGYYWIMGRIDDVINVSGHRLSTIEVESALVSHAHVAEAAAVGRPDEIKGQAIAVFVSLTGDAAPNDDLRKELKESIHRLRRSQKYHVIFYSTDPPLAAPPGRLVNAIRQSKERTFDFIDQTYPEGMTQPIQAMEDAFGLNPDLIYFLSDGDIPEAELLKQNLKEWNHNRKVRIFTIAYVSAAGRGLLEEIAREHNGAFRFVSEYDLGG